MPILDNFGSQFINNASELENGLMSSYDKTKLDSIELKDIDYISDELQNIEEYLKPQYIYGIKIDTTNPDVNNCVTYTDDAVTFTPLKVDQNTGVCNYGSWKTIIDTLLGVTPCLLNNNGEVIFKLNPNDYTKTEDGKTIDIESGEFGQVMIKFNHIYYKFSVEDKYIKFQISNKKIDNTWIDTAFLSEDGIGRVKDSIYISAYEVSQKNNKLQSVSNALPSVKLEYIEIEKLTEFGVFHMINIVKKQFVIFLSYLVTKSIDLKGNIGNGNINGETLKTGIMNNKGLFYGKNNKTEGVKIFGIENLYGNQLKYMHGIVQKLMHVIDKETGMMNDEQHLFIKEFYPYDKISDFTDCGKIEKNIYGYISSIKFLSKSIYFPDKLDGSSISYYKSYFQNGESTDSKQELYGIYGGNNKYGDKCGQEFLLLGYINPENNSATTHLIF